VAAVNERRERGKANKRAFVRSLGLRARCPSRILARIKAIDAAQERAPPAASLPAHSAEVLVRTYAGVAAPAATGPSSPPDLTRASEFSVVSWLLLAALRGPLFLVGRPACFLGQAARGSFIQNVFESEDYSESLVLDYEFYLSVVSTAFKDLLGPRSSTHALRTHGVALVELPVSSIGSDSYNAHAMLLFCVRALNGSRFFLLYNGHLKRATSTKELSPSAFGEAMRARAKTVGGVYYAHGDADPTKGRCRNLCVDFLRRVALEPRLLLDAASAGGGALQAVRLTS